jgi:hypothetical protein
MRLLFLLISLVLVLLLVAACGGGEGHQQEEPWIEDAEAVALRISDLPVDFVEAANSDLHFTNEDSCATALTDDERQECVARLNSWGRQDHYQVEYLSTGPEAVQSAMFHAFSAVSVYETAEGAAQSFQYNSEKLEQSIEEIPEISFLPSPGVGSESLAHVVEESGQVGERIVSMTSCVIDFRRGNVIVRMQTSGATPLASVDDTLALAKHVDQRILRVAD